MVTPRPSWRHLLTWRRALLVAAVALLAGLLIGCGTQTDVRIGTKSQAKTVTKEFIRETPLANGGKVIERTLTTDVVSDENTSERTTTGLDPSTAGLVSTFGQVAGAAVSSATGGLGGGMVELGITAAVTALLSGYGAMKHGQAKQLREERDFHKADAEEGWHRAPPPPKADA